MSSSKHKRSGDFFRKKRIAADLTQSDVAKALGIHSQLISNWERGICKPPFQSLAKIMRLYKLSKSELMHFLLEEQRMLLEKTLAGKNVSNGGKGD